MLVPYEKEKTENKIVTITNVQPQQTRSPKIRELETKRLRCNLGGR